MAIFLTSDATFVIGFIMSATCVLTAFYIESSMHEYVSQNININMILK